MYAVRSVLLKNLLGFDWWVALGWVNIVLAVVSVAELVVAGFVVVVSGVVVVFAHSTFVVVSAVVDAGREVLMLRTSHLDSLYLFDWGICFETGNYYS